jgi:uncharacterized membrane protein (UPF0127 family)
MFRETLPDNAGMLFLFEQTDFHSFRMKNTLIPLEMLRLDADFQVVDMQHAEPCKADPCPLYVPVVPAKYVLEMNAGTGREARIGVGMKCKLVAGNN